jgi:MOSC domain-containing protein YiiM
VKLLSIQVGLPRSYGNENAENAHDRLWTTGFYKEPVGGPVFAGYTHLEGDGQADLQNHGGPDKAINAYPQDYFAAWEAELGISIPHGAFGENLTTSGLVETEVCVGDAFRLGESILQISQPRQPCWKLARRWRIKDLAARVEKTGRTGWYFRVLTEGEIDAPANFFLLERRHPEWTIAAANEVMHHRPTDWEAARLLAACPALSESWRKSLSRRATSQSAADSQTRLEAPNYRYP